MTKKHTLYVFGASVWAAVPELAVVELGYTDEHLEKKIINLAEGENFYPSFLKLNPNATLPTLEADGKVYTNTKDVTHYLVANAPVKVKEGSSFIDLIHEDKYDPNFAFLLARNDDELNAKAGGFPMTFVKNRQAVLVEQSATPEAAAHKEFYDGKIAGNGGLLAIYQGKVPVEVKHGFFAKSKAHWETLRSFILVDLPSYLPESGFIGGERPGEDDFHLGAWIARIGAVSGCTKEADGVKNLEKELEKPVPAKVVSYWNAWSERESWKTVYAAGLH